MKINYPSMFELMSDLKGWVRGRGFCVCSLALDQPCDVKAWERATVHGTEGTTSNVALCMQQLLYTKVPVHVEVVVGKCGWAMYIFS